MNSNQKNVVLNRIFNNLANLDLLGICRECGDGDIVHPIDDEGRCIRHGAWSISKAHSLLMQALNEDMGIIGVVTTKADVFAI